MKGSIKNKIKMILKGNMRRYLISVSALLS